MTKYAVLNRNGIVERIKEVSEALANTPPNWIEMPTDSNVETLSETDYYPIYSTYEIFRANDSTHDLEQDLGAIESDIADLETGKANTTHSHATSDITGLSTVATTGSYDDLTNKPTIPSEYVHPESHPASMITGLSSVATSGSYDDLTDKPNIPSAYTHPTTHPVSMITGLSDVATSGSYDDLSNKPTIPEAYTHPDTHPSSMITGLADVATSGNYNDLTNKPTSMTPTSHTHAMSAITGLLDVLLTDEYGGVNYTVNSGDMLTTIKGWAKGIYTAYFMGGTSGCTNIPKTAESWRCIAHKTGALFGWVLAFGTSGSVFSNYLDNGTWKGWRAIYDVNPTPLWGTSGYYMTAGHTVTPSKKLSECQHGWVLLWSDYDPDTSTSNEKDWVTTVIPKVTPSGGTWSSKLFYCDIPRYVGDNTADVDTERRIIKQIYISDDKIVGHNSNNQDERSDVVLRAVYEY